MRLVPVLIAVVVLAAVGGAFLLARSPPSGTQAARSDQPAAPERVDAQPPTRTPRDRVQLPVRGAPLDDAARALLLRAREAATGSRELSALLIVRGPRVEQAAWVPPLAEEFAGWEGAVLDDLEGDASAGRTIADQVLGQATRALLLPASQERLRALLERLDAEVRAAEHGLLQAFSSDDERGAIERHLARFARDPKEPGGHPVDALLQRVGEREWHTLALPLPLADPGGAERRRIDQLRRLRARGVAPLLDRIHAGLAWLALHQSDDGSFSAPSERCVSLHDGKYVCGAKRKASRRALATTSLAALAFLDFRDQDARGLFEPILARAITWIRRQQRKDGGFGREGYDVAMALLALGQAAAVSGDEAIGEAVTRGWTAYEASAGPRGGYRYVAGGNGDLSVTAWVVQAYEAARNAGLDLPSAAARESLGTFVRSAWDGDNGFSYMLGSPPRASLQSAGMLALHVMGEASDAATRDRFKRALAVSAPEPEERVAFNVYGLYYDVRMELLLADALTPARRDHILLFAELFQTAEGFALGMFDPEPKAEPVEGEDAPRAPQDRWVARGGFTAFTAFSVLTLEHTLFRR